MRCVFVYDCQCRSARGGRTDLEEEVGVSWEIPEKRFGGTCWLRALLAK